MKVIGFNGSPRMLGNTGVALDIVLDRLAANGVEVEHVYMFESTLEYCDGCGACNRNRDGNCIINTDRFPEYLDKMVEADGVILGSPCYFSGVSAHMKAFMDRAGNVGKSTPGMLERKVGAGLVVERRNGGLMALSNINNWFLVNGIVPTPAIDWPVIKGHVQGESRNDKEGVAALESLADNMLWLLRSLR